MKREKDGTRIRSKIISKHYLQLCNFIAKVMSPLRRNFKRNKKTKSRFDEEEKLDL